MNVPLQLTFRDIDASAAVEERVRAAVAKLERHYDRITACRVVVESPHRHHHKGRRYHVRIDLAVPGREIVVGHDPDASADHEDVYLAIRDAFAAALRQVEEHARRLRHQVKTHEPEPMPSP
jgi:ribosomal subunit interface protein